jgi:hypothetical protein
VVQYPPLDVPSAHTNYNDLHQMNPAHNCDTGMPVTDAKHWSDVKILQSHAPLQLEQLGDQNFVRAPSDNN